MATALTRGQMQKFPRENFIVKLIGAHNAGTISRLRRPVCDQFHSGPTAKKLG
jgi:hypothetical protein